MRREPFDWTRCHLCGGEPEADSPRGSPTCSDCRPIREHVVSMSNAPGTSIARCRCGWRSEVAWSHRATVQDAKVRLHWRDVIRRKRAEFDAEFGEGAVARELDAAIAGVSAFIFLSGGAIGLLLLADAMGRAA